MPSTSQAAGYNESRPEVRLSLFANGFDYFVNSDIHDLHDSDDVIDDLLYAVDRILNSEGKDGALFDQEFRLHVTLYHIPSEAMRIAGKLDELSLWNVDEFLSANDKFLLVPPFFTGELEDACILTAIRVGLALNTEYKKCEYQDKLPHYPASADYRDIFEMNYTNPARHNKARKRLFLNTLEWCEELNIDPQGYANLNDLTKLEDLARLLDINLVVYDQTVGSVCVLQTPAVYDTTKPSVSILLMATGTGVKHAATLKNMAKFFHSSNSIRCLYCARNYSAHHYGHHVCKGTELCTACRRPLAKPGDYTDYQIRKQRCTRLIMPGEQEEICPECQKTVKTEECKRNHRRLCKDTLGFCTKCNCRYRKSFEKHDCNRKFCKTCKKFYTVGNVAGQHNCAMSVPGKQKYVNRIIVFDMETRVKDDSHIVSTCIIT